MSEASKATPSSAELLAQYKTFIDEIFRRLNAVSESLGEIDANPEHPDNWKNCDFCWFQIRKICEYLTVAIVLAHHCDTGEIADLKKWRPKDLLVQVSKLSQHPTPVQIGASFTHGPEENKQIAPLAQPVNGKEISAIYGRCSELLHVGSLERILSDNLPSYDVGELKRWVDALRRLLTNHALLLPGVRKALVYTAEYGQSSLLVLGGDEEAIFHTDGLPHFELYAA